MGSCAAPSAKGDDKFITTDYLQQCHFLWCLNKTLGTKTYPKDANFVTMKTQRCQRKNLGPPIVQVRQAANRSDLPTLRACICLRAPTSYETEYDVQHHSSPASCTCPGADGISRL
ncbi:hypothetical protein EVV94_26815 (plasmid) [Enterobacter cloacae]|nr:hypothetical protein EVV94_26815 [Enterobacter cloacae]